jgi:hypothetical protein
MSSSASGKYHLMQSAAGTISLKSLHKYQELLHTSPI